MSRRSLVTLFLLGSSLCLAGQSPAPTDAAETAPPSVAASPVALNANFSGAWVGVLEYRDYQTDGRVFLPTWLIVTSSTNGNAMTLAYTYDDGPTKVVRDRSILTFAENSATLTGDADHPADKYEVEGLEAFRKEARGVLMLSGSTTENGKPVDVRITLTLRRNLFTWRKETRPRGTSAEFKFRDAYTFTREKAPAR